MWPKKMKMDEESEAYNEEFLKAMASSYFTQTSKASVYLVANWECNIHHQFLWNAHLRNTRWRPEIQR